MLAWPSVSGAGWTHPAVVVPAQPADLSPLQIASRTGRGVAIGFGVGDGDSLAGAQALLVTGPPGGRFGPVRAISSAQEVLAMAYLRARLVVLTGSAGSGRTCCDSVAAQSPERGTLRAGQVISVGVSGPVEGALVPDGGRLLAIVASEQGVWASLSAPGGDRFGPPRRLSLAGQFVQSLATAPEPSGGVNIVWSARTGSPVTDGPTQLLAAHAAPGRAPGSGRPILRVPAGRALDELALAPGGTPMLAWVQSAYTRAGRFDSGVWIAPLSGGRLHPSRASSPRVIAGGLVAAGGPDTSQVVSWRGCSASGVCVAQAILVPAAPAGRVPFGPALTLGRTEPEEQPAAGVSAAGRPVVAWVDDRGVRASSAVGRYFAAPRTIARTNYASGVVLAPAGRTGAFAAWIEGTARERVRGAGWLPG